MYPEMFLWSFLAKLVSLPPTAFDTTKSPKPPGVYMKYTNEDKVSLKSPLKYCLGDLLTMWWVDLCHSKDFQKKKSSKTIQT